MNRRNLSSRPLERRRNPFALAALLAILSGAIGVPAALIAGAPAIALAVGAVAAVVAYFSISSAWRWIGTRAAPIAKNETIAFSTGARSDTASGGTVTVTNRRVFFEPAASLFVGNRGGSAKGWEMSSGGISAVRRESQDSIGKSRGAAQRLVFESKGESHWLEPREFDALVDAVAKATGKAVKGA